MRTEYSAALGLLLALAMACKAKPPPVPARNPHGNGSLATLAGFEGEIGLSFKGTLDEYPRPSNPMNVTALVRGGRLRVPLPDLIGATAYMGYAYLIVVPEKKELYSVSDNQLEATLISLDALMAHGQSEVPHAPGKKSTKPALSPSAALPPEAYKSGRTDQVAGYACELWNIAFGADKMELCVANLSTPWLQVPLGALATKYPWAAELTDGNHFPLRLIMRLAGAEQGRLEVTSIAKKSVQANGVQFPPNYHVDTLARVLHSVTVDTDPNWKPL